MAYIDKEKFRMHIVRINRNPNWVTLTEEEKAKFLRMLDEVPTVDFPERSEDGDFNWSCVQQRAR